MSTTFMHHRRDGACCVHALYTASVSKTFLFPFSTTDVQLGDKTFWKPILRNWTSNFFIFCYLQMNLKSKWSVTYWVHFEHTGNKNSNVFYYAKRSSYVLCLSWVKLSEKALLQPAWKQGSYPIVLSINNPFSFSFNLN